MIMMTERVNWNTTRIRRKFELPFPFPGNFRKGGYRIQGGKIKCRVASRQNTNKNDDAY